VGAGVTLWQTITDDDCIAALEQNLGDRRADIADAATRTRGTALTGAPLKAPKHSGDIVPARSNW